MAKHQKKLSPQQRAKLLTAQNRKLFFERFRNLLKVLTGTTELYNSIPEKILEKIYEERVLSMVVEAEKGNFIDPQILKSIKESLQLYSRNETCTITETNETITISDFLTTGITLMRCKDLIKPADFPDAEKLILLSDQFIKSQEKAGSAFESLMKIFWIAIILESKLNGQLYCAEMKPGFTFSNGGYYGCMKLLISSSVPQKIEVTINESVRPAYRVGGIEFPNQLNWCEREASLFGLTGNNNMLPVYIQMHAINRIEERLDCASKNILNFSIYTSLKEGTVKPGLNNQYLIEFRYFNWKLGYLLCIVLKDKIVARTFLFLTNNGTPEGKKLYDIAGIKKYDKKYLQIDKLSTFVDPELLRNETLRRLFFDAGCGDLFDYAENKMKANDAGVSHNIANALINYLMLKPVEADAPPDFSDALAHERYRSY